MDKSTGEGVSPGMSFGVIFPVLVPLRPERFEPETGVITPALPIGGKSGVEFADLVPPRRLPRRVRFILGIEGATAPAAEAGFCGVSERRADAA